VVEAARLAGHAMHVDVSVARERADHRVATALRPGGPIVDGSNALAGWILADSAGKLRLPRRRAWPTSSETIP
jgi:4a-hydroxytetrahydrobiopterin dehydratase